MKPSLSTRALQMPASPIRKLMPFADAAKKRGVHVYHLNIGQPDIETPSCMRVQLGLIDTPQFAYTPSAGTPEFLEAMRHYYGTQGISLSIDQILATTGGSEALLFAFLACANQGDEVIVPEPFYANYLAFATMAGVRLVPLLTHGEDGFHLPADEEFEKLRSDRTRFVLLCNPNNPTGTVYSREELLRVAAFCRRHSLFLVADEVYREFTYDGLTATSALQLEGFEEFVIVADSLSKRYSACGIRLGTLVTRNPEVYGAVLRMAQGRLSAPGIAQAIAAHATELAPEYTPGVVSEYQRRRDVLYEGLCSIPGIFFRKPEGAFYFIARLPVDDAEDFARFLLSDFERNNETVMLSPAAGFYATPGAGRDEVRIAYVLNERELRRSVELLREALELYRSMKKNEAVMETPV
jgi:aspartate aminotransferase